MAFFYNGTSIFPLGTLGGYGSGAGAINEAGDIVGEAAVPSGQAHAAQFVVGGTPIDLAPAWYASSAADINALGQIVGKVRAALDSGPQAALFGIGQAPILLKDLIPMSSGWDSLLWANDINDFGQIVGVGILSGEPGLQAFVMTPVPEPSSLWILAGFLPFCHFLRSCSLTCSTVGSIIFGFQVAIADSAGLRRSSLRDTHATGDLNGDGQVNLDDLDIVFEQYRLSLNLVN